MANKLFFVPKKFIRKSCSTQIITLDCRENADSTDYECGDEDSSGSPRSSARGEAFRLNFSKGGAQL